MSELVAGLENSSSVQVQAAARMVSRPLSRAELALCAWAWQCWHFDPPALPRSRGGQFQVSRLAWRATADWEDAPAARMALEAVLQQQLPAQWQELVRAAGLFNGIFPVAVYIGNGDTAGYELDCRQRWHEFELFREWFAEALPLSEALRREWVTLAQVYWSHFRWQPDEAPGGTFSAPACDYLLARAVTLAVPYPIQYYYFYQQLPTPYTRHGEATEGQELPLQSGLGLTYFYYAQYCQYHRQDYDRARAYYQRFLVAEPGCLPDNRFRLFSRDATARSYPPSTQEAQNELGNLALLQGLLPAAQVAFEQAIALRPDNFQAPYERLAEVCRQQGNLAGALTWLARKAAVCVHTPMQDYAFREGSMGVYCYYDPSQPAGQDMNGYPGGWSWSDPVARVRVVEVSDLYKELADTYFYELGDYEPAGRYYKAYLRRLGQRQTRTPREQVQELDARESQIRLAMEQRDYWQARTLCEKLLATAPDNATAYRYLAHIRQRLPY